MAAALIHVVLFVAFFQDYIFMFSEIHKRSDLIWGSRAMMVLA